MDNNFSSNKPYLFRAIYQWLLDNGATPYLLVDATQPDVEVPTEHIKDGQIVLNVEPNAISQWYCDNDFIAFSARFGGVPRKIQVPVNALLAVYAQENGLGMAFPATDVELPTADDSQSKLASDEPQLAATTEKNISASQNRDNASELKKGSHLKIVK